MIERRSKEKIPTIEIYTDGSLKKMGQQTFGAWAFIVVEDGRRTFSLSGYEYNTTSQRMELTAAIQALEYIKEVRRPSERVVIYSDSAYLINCCNQEWYTKWLKNGWVNAEGKNVANRDLWLALLPYFDNFWYTFRKVPGHAGLMWNEQCDALAQATAENFKKNWRGLERYGRE